MLLGNFSQGSLVLSSTRSSTKVVFFFCAKTLFSASVCIHWGNGTHFKDKHEKHPDKTDNKQQAWVQKYWYPQSFLKSPLPIREQLQYLSLFVILSWLFLLFCMNVQRFPMGTVGKKRSWQHFIKTLQGCRTFSPSPSFKTAHLCLSFPLLLLLTLIPLTFLHQKFTNESLVVSSYALGAKVL